MNIQFASLGHASETLSGPAAQAQAAIAVMPYTDRALAERSARQLAARAGSEGLLLALEDRAREGFVALANRAFRATSCEFFGYVAQDAFAGRRWLARGIAALKEGGMGLLGFNDGKWAGLLAGFGLASREWAAGNYGGDFFCPQYARHYADTELTVLAMGARRYAYDPNCVMVEVDWDKDRAGVNEADRALYRARAAGGFDARVSEPRLLGLFS